MTKTKAKPGKNRESRRGGGLRPVAALVPKVTGRSFGRRGLAEGGLAAAWREIMGAELAEVCRPQKLAFPRRDRRSEGVLTLRTALDQATVLQHLEPLILERINGFFGYRAVARLKLQQGPLPPKRRAPRAEAPEMPGEVRAALRSRLATIGDEGLREALERLGEAVYADSRRHTET